MLDIISNNNNQQQNDSNSIFIQTASKNKDN